MKALPLLIALAALFPQHGALAQDATSASEVPGAGEVVFDEALAAEIKALEEDLAGPIATIDHQLVEFGTYSSAEVKAVAPYSRGQVALGFPEFQVPQVNFADGKYWMLQQPLRYLPGMSGKPVTVPSGFVHDFASVPDVVTIGVPKHGPYNRAAIIHDFLYWTQPCSRLQADNILLISMVEAGVHPARRLAIYVGVRGGGWVAWDDNIEERTKKLPRVIPEDRRSIPSNATWPAYRSMLFSSGVLDALTVDDDDFCKLGDSTKVPPRLMADRPAQATTSVP